MRPISQPRLKRGGKPELFLHTSGTINNTISHTECGSKEKQEKVTGSSFPDCLIGHAARHALKHWAGRCHSPGPRNLNPMQESRSSSGQGPMRTSSGPTFYLDLHSHHHRSRSDSGFFRGPGHLPGTRFLKDWDSRRLGLTREPRRPDPGFGFRSALTQLRPGPNSRKKDCGSCPSEGSTRLPKPQLR